ncbi:unnamed protein product, partial [Ectocarpus sp. 8 AP-2014]
RPGDAENRQGVPQHRGRRPGEKPPQESLGGPLAIPRRRVGSGNVREFQGRGADGKDQGARARHE